jgi:hypothetical protein
MLVETEEGHAGGLGRGKPLRRNHREGTSAEFLKTLTLLRVNLRHTNENEGYIAAR